MHVCKFLLIKLTKYFQKKTSIDQYLLQTDIDNTLQYHNNT